jgi:sugar O-acyltransferase (sialic acid O-acetyltransferase NeuD family)
MNSLYIYGASGHAKVVIDIAEKSGYWEIRGILDDNPKLIGGELFGYPILGGSRYVERLDPLRDRIFVAIGSNAVRRRIGNGLLAQKFELPTLIHPSAVIGRNVIIGWGTVIMARVVINPATSVGDMCILNTACTLDHDNRLGEAVHISPGANLAGNVTVGDESWVGIGSSVIEGRTIGQRCMVGGGAVVIANVRDDTSVVGVPARPLAVGARIPQTKANAA